MDRTTETQRVGPAIFETDAKGKVKRLPPKFFGEVKRTANNGESAYVLIDGETEETHFHASELDPEPPKE